MRLLELTLGSPEENLALEEALLDGVEQGTGEETLRFWESPVPFVVLGIAQRWQAEVVESACAADNIPILRRCSGGGCVLQGPGSLNYTFVVRYERHPELRQLRDSYTHILGRLANAFEDAGICAQMTGISDLAVKSLKVSGNAQKRRKHAFLHHGTLLYKTLPIARYLREPVDRPDYRGDRAHDAFIGRVDFTPAVLRRLVTEALCPEAIQGPLTARELTETRRLTVQKYSTDAWNRRR